MIDKDDDFYSVLDEDTGAAQAHQHELEVREQTEKLNAAFAKARAEIENPKFDATNPHFRSRFASLKSVVNATIHTLAEHGIAVFQDFRTVRGGVEVYTHLCHESGQERTFGPFWMPITKDDAQGYASATTYARRYHLMAVTVVVGDDDDDGNSASESAFSSTQQRTKLRNQLIKAAEAGDDETVRKITGELDNDQKAEMWGVLSKSQKVLIKEAMERKSDES